MGFKNGGLAARPTGRGLFGSIMQELSILTWPNNLRADCWWRAIYRRLSLATMNNQAGTNSYASGGGGSFAPQRQEMEYLCAGAQEVEHAFWMVD